MKKLLFGLLILIVLITNIAAAPVKVPTGTLTRIDALSTPEKGGILTFNWTFSLKDNAKWRLYITSWFYDSITGQEYNWQMDCIDQQDCWSYSAYNQTEFGMTHSQSYRLELLDYYFEIYPCEQAPKNWGWCDQTSTAPVRVKTVFWVRNQNTNVIYTLDTVTTMVSR